jgi:hypothetical protein
MATIVILEHLVQQGLEVPYMVYPLARRWRAAGHRVLVHYGAKNPPPGDIAVLNLDLTAIPAEYAGMLSCYPHVINGAVLDISKHTFSQDLVGQDSDWGGPVVVKTDANYGGRVDQLLRSRVCEVGAQCDIPTGPVLDTYPIFGSIREMPQKVWSTPGLVVEKFLPERDETGYYLRIWTFFGDRERSSRYRAAVPIIKSGNVLGRESVPVPEEIRAWRDTLRFDFGKFDYVRCDGRYVLLDVNRTPSAPSGLIRKWQMRASFDLLAEGLEGFVRSPVRLNRRAPA